METIHNALRPFRRGGDEGAGKTRRDHLVVFREFLEQLDRSSRRRAAATAKAKTRRGSKR